MPFLGSRSRSSTTFWTRLINICCLNSASTVLALHRRSQSANPPRTATATVFPGIHHRIRSEEPGAQTQSEPRQRADPAVLYTSRPAATSPQHYDPRRKAASTPFQSAPRTCSTRPCRTGNLRPRPEPAVDSTVPSATPERRPAAPAGAVDGRTAGSPGTGAGQDRRRSWALTGK